MQLNAQTASLKSKEAELLTSEGMLRTEADRQRQSYTELRAAAAELGQKKPTMEQHYAQLRFQLEQELAATLQYVRSC